MSTADELFQELTSVIDTALGEDNCTTTTAREVYADLAVWCHQQAAEIAREDAVEAADVRRLSARSKA